MNENSEPDRNFDKLIGIVRDLGYRAQPIANTSIPSSIKTGMSGFSVVLFHYPGHSVQLYAGFKVDEGSKFGLQEASDFNDDNRFIKCYIARGGIRFEADFFFDITSTAAADDLNRIFDAWEICLNFASEALSKAHEKENAGAASEPPPGRSETASKRNIRSDAG